MTVLLKATNVALRKKIFGEYLFTDINLTLKKGEKVAIFGSTASGKTTLLNLFSGIIKPTKGSIEKKGKLAYATQNFLLYEDLTVEENIDFICSVNGFKHKDKRLFIEKTGLTGWENVRSGSLPEGLRKMLQIACAFSKDFSFILVDEPITGLDYNLKNRVWTLLDEAIANGKGVLVATAVEDDIAHCDRIYNLDEIKHGLKETTPAAIEHKATDASEAPKRRRRFFK